MQDFWIIISGNLSRILLLNAYERIMLKHWNMKKCFLYALLESNFWKFCWAKEEKNEIILKIIPKLNWKQSPKFCTFTKKRMKSNFFKNLKRKYNTNNQVISFSFFFLFLNTIIIYLAWSKNDRHSVTLFKFLLI